ncbi:MAG: hypothetical protein NTW03_02155, partial [Verrucomicrobia bacterium]|nr:hypothetical protein [Verrucomicrobiota bacterium]
PFSLPRHTTESMPPKENPMTKRALLALGLGLLAAGLLGCGESQPAQAVAEITKLNGKVSLDENKPDKPVISVDFKGKGITDASLVHLKDLTGLQTLNLESNKVTDAGLVHLRRLTNLQNLYLVRCAVSDQGLEHLKGLTRLRKLDLQSTKVTDAGVRALQQALPKARIYLYPQDKAFGEIKNNGGQVTVDETSPGQPVMGVDHESRPAGHGGGSQ